MYVECLKYCITDGVESAVYIDASVKCSPVFNNIPFNHIHTFGYIVLCSAQKRLAPCTSASVERVGEGGKWVASPTNCYAHGGC